MSEKGWIVAEESDTYAHRVDKLAEEAVALRAVADALVDADDLAFCGLVDAVINAPDVAEAALAKAIDAARKLLDRPSPHMKT